MRLLIVGTMEGYITAAGKIAHDRGAKVSYTDGIDKALNALRGGQGADLVMIDVKFDIARLIDALKLERITIPVIACGIGTDAQAAVRAQGMVGRPMAVGHAVDVAVVPVQHCIEQAHAALVRNAARDAVVVQRGGRQRHGATSTASCVASM